MTIQSQKVPWKSYSDVLKESYEICVGRQLGHIKSLKTKWPEFNKIGLNGIEWQSIYTIGARPGVGKTFVAATLSRDVQKYNPDEDFDVLHFQFEMLSVNMGIRELASATGMDTRYIQSAEDDGMPKISDVHLAKLKDYSESQDHRKEYIIDKSMNVSQIKKTIIQFYEIRRKPIFITLDHTLLIKKGASEKNKQATLENLAIMLTEMKKSYPVTFIILSQLNRSIDESDRQKPGMLSNYPTPADVYGSDFLMQCTDVMIVYNRPAKYNLSIYGPLKYEITPNDKYLLAMHVLKNRFGTLGVQWYFADYSTMRLQSADTPKTKQKLFQA